MAGVERAKRALWSLLRSFKAQGSAKLTVTTAKGKLKVILEESFDVQPTAIKATKRPSPSQLRRTMQFPVGISIDLLVWLSCRVSYINNNTISGFEHLINYNSMYIIIGYDINTPLMTMYEIMTLCRHRMGWL